MAAHDPSPASLPLDDTGPWLVEVALPVPLRQTFTYKIPAGDINPAVVKRGLRVLVPFRSKLLYGITMSDAYQSADAYPRTRYLVSCDTRQIVIAEEVHHLLDWMVRYYRAPIGEAVKLALPPGVLNEKEIQFALSPNGKTFAESEAGGIVLAQLLGGPLTRKEWQLKAKTEIKLEDIRFWEDQGYLFIQSRDREKESIPHVTVVVVTEAGRAVDPTELGRAYKQIELLRWLRVRETHFARIPEIYAVFGSASPLLNQLEKKGFIERKRIPKYELLGDDAETTADAVHTLTEEQGAAFEEITAGLDLARFCSFLLFGVTGAGKTEIYLRAIQHCLENGRQALFLVPEIALTPLMHRRIRDRFGERLAILHSAVGMSQRSEAWANVLAGKVDVVLGARSGVFAPLPRLGLVIVDEEHDQSYKQNDGIRYHARDLALVRGKMAEAVVVLGSATPSLESWQNHRRGRHHLLTLTKRATKAKLPEVEILDMRGEFKAQRKRPLLSRRLQAAIGETLKSGNQVMILLNRRGYHNFLLCRKCGHVEMCSQCEVCLTFHRTDERLHCHYCNEIRPVPAACSSCAADGVALQFFGEGTQQIEAHIQELFPDYVVDRMDRDRLSAREAHQKILDKFESRQTDILVGTQMIAKGHDFPNVTLVGIVNADQGLRIPDFRSAETVFQLLTQVAGRSGRGKNPGRVVIQTYMPEHYCIRFAADHDFLAFLKKELTYREHLFYPPFAHMINIMVTHKDDQKAAQAIQWMAAQLNSVKQRADLVVLGPTKAAIGRIKGAWRYQIVLKSGDRASLHGFADQVVETCVARGLIERPAVTFDIDPYQFL
ncbi:replication restart helicase PriA [Acanthopleuribacter pedis]|uniref:Replication restart protein PriA n=1 Tax=Acanthopleuribacter pedis TaxID=442870 RepID=A0A8J7QCS7_9BACT|nr:primosomal protein N' [Acanthopleuribacter pedis]MBO1317195.1 primosomal protein N' [Acanthopleuribacter pedis]